MSAEFALDLVELDYHASLPDRLMSGAPDPRLESVRRAYRDGIELPPIVVIRRARRWDLWDGRHRLTVARERGLRTIGAVEVGSPTNVAPMFQRELFGGDA
jgi:hypothetical protein